MLPFTFYQHPSVSSAPRQYTDNTQRNFNNQNRFGPRIGRAAAAMSGTHRTPLNTHYAYNVHTQNRFTQNSGN